MAITPVGTVVEAHRPGTNQNVSISLPTSNPVQEGDFVLLGINIDATAGLVLPNEFTYLADVIIKDSAHGDNQMVFGYRVVGASEPSLYTYTRVEAGEDVIAALAVFRGVDTANPFDVSMVNDSYVGHASPVKASIVLPSIETVTDGAVIYAVMGGSNAIGWQNGKPWLSSMPASMTEVANKYVAGGTAAAMIAAAWEEIPIAGATGTRTFQQPTENGFEAFMVALRPAEQIAPPEPGDSPLDDLKVALFANGEEGGAYVFKPTLNGVTAIYMDSAGTQPAVNDGDPINYFVDFSGRGNHVSVAGSSGLVLRKAGDLYWAESDLTENRPILPASLFTETTKTVGVSYTPDNSDKGILFSAETDGASFQYVFYAHTNTTTKGNVAYGNFLVDGVSQPEPATRQEAYDYISTAKSIVFGGLTYTGGWAAERTNLLKYSGSGYAVGGKLRALVISEASGGPAEQAAATFLAHAYDGTLEDTGPPPPTGDTFLSDLVAKGFSAGEQGGIYAFTPVVDGQVAIYQDEAGAIPANAHNDPINYLVDLSGKGNHISITGNSGLVLKEQNGKYWARSSVTEDRPVLPQGLITADTQTVGFSYTPDNDDKGIFLSAELDTAGYHFVWYRVNSSAIRGSVSYTGILKNGASQTIPTDRNETLAIIQGAKSIVFTGTSYTGGWLTEGANLLKYSSTGYAVGGKLYSLVITEATGTEVEEATDLFLQKAHEGLLNESSGPYPFEHKDIDHIQVSGQSLAAGYTALPGLTLTQPFQNIMGNTSSGTMDGSHNSSGIGGPPTSTGFVPLKFVDRGDKLGETVGLAMANFAKKLANDQYPGNTYVALVSNNASGGRRIEQLDKGNSYYDYGIQQDAHYRTLAANLGKTYETTSIAWLQGETNITSGLSGADYYNRVLKYINDVNADIPQTRKVKFLTYQLVCHTWRGTPKGKTPDIALQLWYASLDHPDVHMVAPLYIFEHAVDGLHITNLSEQWLGQYFGKVHKKVVLDGVDWKPVQPRSASRSGSTISVLFDVPVPPLVLDTSWVSNPGDYGFEVYRGSTKLDIYNVAVTGPDVVAIELESDPGTDVEVRYAYGSDGQEPGPLTGARGNLRDSDSVKGMYNGPNGQPADLYNYAVISKITTSGTGGTLIDLGDLYTTGNASASMNLTTEASLGLVPAIAKATAGLNKLVAVKPVSSAAKAEARAYIGAVERIRLLSGLETTAKSDAALTLVSKRAVAIESRAKAQATVKLNSYSTTRLYTTGAASASLSFNRMRAIQGVTRATSQVGGAAAAKYILKGQIFDIAKALSALETGQGLTGTLVDTAQASVVLNGLLGLTFSAYGSALATMAKEAETIIPEAMRGSSTAHLTSIALRSLASVMRAGAQASLEIRTLRTISFTARAIAEASPKVVGQGPLNIVMTSKAQAIAAAARVRTLEAAFRGESRAYWLAGVVPIRTKVTGVADTDIRLHGIKNLVVSAQDKALSYLALTKQQLLTLHAKGAATANLNKVERIITVRAIMQGGALAEAQVVNKGVLALLAAGKAKTEGELTAVRPIKAALRGLAKTRVKLASRQRYAPAVERMIALPEGRLRILKPNRKSRLTMMQTYWQQPYDKLDYPIDYRGISTSETVALDSYTVTVEPAGLDVTADPFNTYGLAIWVTGGIAHESYHITVRAELSDGLKVETDFMVRVYDED